jgi:hypothetical protein
MPWGDLSDVIAVGVLQSGFALLQHDNMDFPWATFSLNAEY